MAVSLTRSGLNDVTFFIVVNNLGPDAADGAVVHDEISSSFSSVTWTCTASNGAVCSNSCGSGNLLDETIAQLHSSGTVTFTIVGNVSSIVDNSNLVMVTVPAGVDDLNMSNNEAWVARTFGMVLPLMMK